VYRSIDTRIWDDPAVMGLSPHSKLLFVWLITNRFGHMGGIYLCPYQVAPSQLGLTKAQTEKAWAELLKTKVVERLGSLVWVVNMLKYQGKGAKIWRSVAILIETLHPSLLINRYLLKYTRVRDYLSKGYRMSNTLASSSAPQDQDQSTGTGSGSEVRTCTDKPRTRSGYPDGFESWWGQLRLLLSGPRPRGKAKVLRVWEEAGGVVQRRAMTAAAGHYAIHNGAKSTQSKHRLLASTFYGPSRQWEEWQDGCPECNPGPCEPDKPDGGPPRLTPAGESLREQWLEDQERQDYETETRETASSTDLLLVPGDES